MSSIAFVTLVSDRAQFAGCQESLRVQADPFPEWLAVEPNAQGWNAAQGLNYGLERLDAEWIVCVHQDVLFPPGFWRRFSRALAGVPADAAMAGLVGCERDGRFRGHIVDPNGHCFWGPLPRCVLTLDEVLLVIRKASGLRFDPEVPGFHCYGADLCFEADKRGFRTVALDSPVVHLSTGRLDASYQRSSDWLLAKWGARYGHVLPMPAIVVQDASRAGWWRRTMIRWRRRGDRLARNNNPCSDASCAVAGFAAEVGGETRA